MKKGWFYWSLRKLLQIHSTFTQKNSGRLKSSKTDSALTHGWISGPWVQVWKPLQLAIDKCHLLRFSDSGSLKVDKTSYCGQYTLSCLYCLTRHKYSFMENTKHINFLGCLTGGSMWPILRDRDEERKFLPTTCQLCASCFTFFFFPPTPWFFIYSSNYPMNKIHYLHFKDVKRINFKGLP